MRESRYNVWVERDDKSYVYNGVSGGLLAMATDDRVALQESLVRTGRPTCSPHLAEQLVRGRMLVSDEFDELQPLARRYEASRRDRTRFGLTLVTSLGCNFDCPYCFEAKHPSLMDERVQDLLMQVVDDQLRRVKSFNVTWYGGEPLVGKQALLALSDQFIERCAAADVEYDARIITNGSLLTEQTCAQLRDRRVVSAQVTLDGPPAIHDAMRPFSSGRGSFWRIVKNLRHASAYLHVAVRVNLEGANFPHVEELFEILADEGLAGKISVSPGQLVSITANPAAPSAQYGKHHQCFTTPEFARAEQEFFAIARRYGFGQPTLPRPISTPCTAVRANELVVGSKGELYKCWDSVGNALEVIGHIRDYENANGRLQKWLKYDPFANDECRGCIALPVCMGGCAHHAMQPAHYENRCGTFRHTFREQVLGFVDRATSSEPRG